MQARKEWIPARVCALVALIAVGPAATAEGPVEVHKPAEAPAPVSEASALVPGTDQLIHLGAGARQEAAAILEGLAMMAFVDPETGALRAPTPEEAKQLAAAGQRLRSLTAPSTFQVRQFEATGGGTAAEVPPELHSHTSVEISAAGEARLRCSGSDEAGHVAPGRSAVEEE